MQDVITKKAVEAILEDKVIKKSIRSRKKATRKANNAKKDKKDKKFKDKLATKSLEELPREFR
jgi:hypothetical protein